MQTTNIRNIAIVAHVDHGKTTLVDQLLKQSDTLSAHEQIEERAMDSNDLERERGITILAKNTAIRYKDFKINILDTPGHADFSGEVERILKMVDGIVLVVDAFEGCMPQTRFVLKKALENKLTPIVVVNKIDRENARPQEVVDEVLDLFIDLGADEDQLEFPVVFASGLAGTASLTPDQQDDNMHVLLDQVIEHIPAPESDPNAPLQMQVTMLDYNDYLGRIGIGRIYNGKLAQNQQLVVARRDGKLENVKLTKLFGFLGLKRMEISEAQAGDIVAIAGIEDVNVGETVCDSSNPQPLPLLRIEEPTLKMLFMVNNSPFAGKEGKHVTSRKLKDRLAKELETDVSLRVVDTDNPEIFEVAGRGELHLSILIETMRREGFELQVSKPEVILRHTEEGLQEPFERAVIDVPEEYTGAIMESFGTRKAELVNMQNNGFGQVRMEFLVPSRGLIGYRTEFITQTRGYGIMTHSFDHYGPAIDAALGGRRFGALIAHETGTASTYGLLGAEDRGIMFITPGTDVYEGMIIGEHNRDSDLIINVCKVKAANNIRSATKEETVKLKVPRKLTLEAALEFLQDDELCEITPNSIRLRKKFLKKTDRDRAAKTKKVLG